MFEKIRIIGLLAGIVLLAGCGSVPMASDQLDAQAKTFSVHRGKANLYVFRNESMGSPMKMDVVVDGKPVGQTVGKTYVALEVAPGKHTVVSKAENDSTLDVDTKSGKNYFIWQEVKVGLISARSNLHLVDDATGKAGVAECKLIEMQK